MADDPTTPSNPADEPWQERWQAFCAQLERTAQTVLASAPPGELHRAEGLRYVGRIARHALQRFIEERDPAAPVLGGLPKLGGDNPDYVYTGATISPDYEYRLTGTLGDATYLGFGSYSGEVGTEEGLRLSGYLDGADLESDPDGRFEVIISATEQEKNWLPMTSETTQLMVRELLLDRREQRSAALEIETRSGQDTASPFLPEGYAARLDDAGRYVEGAIAQFLDWSSHLASRPNHVGPLDPELAAGAQGDPHTHYYGGYFQVANDEALVIRFTPPQCEYWNLQLCNHWLESLDRPQHRVSINHHNAQRRPGGEVVVVVSQQPPPATQAPLNWLDAAGHDQGCMFFRQVGTPDPCSPVCRVVNRKELNGS